MSVLFQRVSLTHQLKVAKWFLPLFLFLTASGYETIGHVLEKKGVINPNFVMEVTIFGIVDVLARMLNGTAGGL